MGSPGVDEWAPGQSCSHFSSSQHSSPWPWQLLRSRRPQAPTLTLRPILGTATTATGHTAARATTERGLLMKPPPPQAPTLTLRPILTTATAGGTGHTDMVTMATDPTAITTMARGLLMPLPSLAPALMLRLTPGTDTTATATGHTDMVIGVDTVDTTGDKKWSSTTTSDLFLPTHL